MNDYTKSSYLLANVFIDVLLNGIRERTCNNYPWMEFDLLIVGGYDKTEICQEYNPLAV